MQQLLRAAILSLIVSWTHNTYAEDFIVELGQSLEITSTGYFRNYDHQDLVDIKDIKKNGRTETKLDDKHTLIFTGKKQDERLLNEFVPFFSFSIN